MKAWEGGGDLKDTHTHTVGKVCYFMEGNQCCLMKVNHNLFSFSFFHFSYISQDKIIAFTQIILFKSLNTLGLSLSIPMTAFRLLNSCL